MCFNHESKISDAVNTSEISIIFSVIAVILNRLINIYIKKESIQLFGAIKNGNKNLL